MSTITILMFVSLSPNLSMIRPVQIFPQAVERG